jgi:hypothetical protein
VAQSDPWAVGGPQSPSEEAPAIWAQPAAPYGTPSRLYVVVAVLFFAAAAMHPLWLAIAPTNSLIDRSMFAFPSEDANRGYVLLLFVAAGTLVLIRRTRVFGLGLAIALPVTWLATDPSNFRPSLFTRSADARTAMIVFISFELATVVAAVFAGFALRDLLRREPPAAIAEPAQKHAIRVLCLGGGAVLGGGLWLVSGLMSWRVDHYGLTDLGQLHTYYCCNWTARTDFGKASVLGSFVAAAGFAVAAGFVRSRALSAAWLLGPFLFKAAQLPDIGIRAIFPSESLLGWNVARRYPNYVVTTTLLAGFWLALGGTLVVVIAACLRLRIGRQSVGPYAQTLESAIGQQP